MDKLSDTVRTYRPSKAQLLFLPALSAFLTFNISKGATEDTVEHPFIEQKDIKSETCLTCHPAKKEGKFVHSAVGMGCDNCHQILSLDNRTTITLVTSRRELCSRCHEIQADAILHGPYKDGECLICHNPHASEFKAQTRASIESLCMSCHGTSKPEVRVVAGSKVAILLDGQAYDFASFENAPKISGQHSEDSAPRPSGRSLIAKDSRNFDAQLNCDSCHDPHASKAEHLLRKAPKNRSKAEALPFGDSVHLPGEAGEPRNVPALQDSISGGRL